MAIEEKSKYDEDDSLYNLQKEDEEIWDDIKELAETQYENWAKYLDGQSGKIAKNPKDYVTRSCVRCNGFLFVFEETENSHLLLQCKDCGMKQWSQDISPYDSEEVFEIERERNTSNSKRTHIPDDLYRKIPDSLVLEYTEMRKNMKRD